LRAQQQWKWQTGDNVNGPLLNLLMDATPSALQWNFESDLAFFDISAAAPSSPYVDYLTRSPMLNEWSPLPSWTNTGDHREHHSALDPWAQFMIAPRYPEVFDPNIDEALVEPLGLVEPSTFIVTDGTPITP
jgi:hypothetical protein